MSQTKAQLVSPIGILTATGLNVAGIITANNFVKSGGASNEFLKADGSADSSNYATVGKSVALSIVFG
jgi:hypothetical protein